MHRTSWSVCLRPQRKLSARENHRSQRSSGLIKIQEAENQIITDYEVCDQRPADSSLLTKSIEAHQQKLGRVPHTVATDAGFFSAQNEEAATKMGVKRVAIPNRSTKSAERRLLQKKRWFRQAQAWRTGCE